MNQLQIPIPSLVRIKPGALPRLGIYLQRQQMTRIAWLYSAGLPQTILDIIEQSLQQSHIITECRAEVHSSSFEEAVERFVALPTSCQAILGVGGGKALDLAKHVAFLANRPYFTVPTSLSNDSFCSPTASLTIAGQRRSLRSKPPEGVILDTSIIAQAPEVLWWSGVGDLVAKITAVADWKRAFHAVGEPINDLAALLSDATVYQFFARPERSLEGIRLLGTAFLLNGMAMTICGSSRPASGAEHLISHALDAISARPRLHGLQVGVATYLVSRLQGGSRTEEIATLFDRTRFWDAIRADPFDRQEWQQAITLAPTIKANFYTVLNEGDAWRQIEEWIEADPRLQGLFR